MQKISEKSKIGSLRLIKSSPEDLVVQMIAIKKFSQECSKVGIGTQPLINVLSIIYDKILVERALLGLMDGKILNEPILLNRTAWREFLEEQISHNLSMDALFRILQNGLATDSTEDVSPSITNGV